MSLDNNKDIEPKVQPGQHNPKETSFSVINPYTSKSVLRYDYTTSEEVEISLAKVYKGRKTLELLTSKERSEILLKLAGVLDIYKSEMAEIITKEMGKTLADSTIEITRAIDTIVCSSEEAKRISGQSVDADSWGAATGKTAVIQHFPLGVVFAITPFNFPINLAVHKIAPAFAAGNTVLFKPHPQCYLSSKKLVEYCYEAGMTEDMIQFICPDISDMESIIKDQRVDCISLTGGIKAAEAVTKAAGMKKLLFELGGNDPLIVMDDGDVEKAVLVTINQRFGTAGQRCTAAKRVFVHNKVYDEFRRLLIEKTKDLVIGDPMDEKTFIGPVVSELVAIDAMERIEEAVKLGAVLLAGGKREGAIIHPTILEKVPHEANLVRTETFAPVVPLFRFDSVDEVLEIINNSQFGLQSGIFTNRLDVIKKIFKSIQVGALAVNDGPGYRKEHLPFGGVKGSGLGREGVKYAIEEMSYVKTLIF